jgi:hypothetical protein
MVTSDHLLISCLVNGLRSEMRAFCPILMQKEAAFTTICDRFQREWTRFQPKCGHIRHHLDSGRGLGQCGSVTRPIMNLQTLQVTRQFGAGYPHFGQTRVDIPAFSIESSIPRSRDFSRASFTSSGEVGGDGGKVFPTTTRVGPVSIGISRAMQSPIRACAIVSSSLSQK